MSSENKKNKEKNSNSYHGFALKESTMKLKRLLFFNGSMRKKNNQIDMTEFDERYSDFDDEYYEQIITEVINKKMERVV